MVRALITIPENYLKELDRFAHEKKQSRAEIIRQAINQYLQNNKKKKESWEEKVRKTAGILKDKIKDTDVYLEELRSEWVR